MNAADQVRPLSTGGTRHVATLACALAFVLLAGCGRTPEVAAAPKPAVHQVQLARPVAGAPVDYVTVGSVVSDHRVQLSSRVASYVRDVLVREGDVVHRDQVLVRLDAADVDGAVRQSEASLAAAQSNSRDATEDLQRFEKLRASGTASDNDLRKVRLRHDTASQQVNQARAALETARAQRAYVEIRSPVEGTVVARLKQPGDLATPGLPLLVVDGGTELTFETYVADEVVHQVSKGQAVAVLLDTRPDALAGTVKSVVPSADPITRSHLVRIGLASSDGVAPGNFGRATFPIGQAKSPVVSRAALVERGGLVGVYVADDKHLAHFRWLRIGREWADRVEVAAGLGGQERYVLTPDASLREGDVLEAVEVHHD